MEADAKKWLRDRAEAFLRRIGVRQGQAVLDLGCNEGNYTMPAARVVGADGMVYALDKKQDSLDALTKEARKRRLRNIEPIHIGEAEALPLRPCSVDVALLYDVLHGGYFPEAAQRSAVLRRIYRALKPEGLLSCYLTHLRRYGLTFKKLLGEIAEAGFRLDGKRSRVMIHDGKLVRGWVFSFTRPVDAVPPRPESHR